MSDLFYFVRSLYLARSFVRLKTFKPLSGKVACSRPSVGGAVRRAPGERGKIEGGLGREDAFCLSFPDPPRFRSRLDSLAFLLANVFVRYHQSTVGKKTADLHFTTIPKIYNSQNFFSSIKLVRKDTFKSVLAGLNRFTKVGKVKHNSLLVETFVTVIISANLKIPPLSIINCFGHEFPRALHQEWHIHVPRLRLVYSGSYSRGKEERICCLYKVYYGIYILKKTDENTSI